MTPETTQREPLSWYLIWTTRAVLLALGIARIRFEFTVGLGQDSHAYWLAATHRDGMYGVPLARDAYLYTPVLAQLLWPVAHLPFAVFGVLWGSAEAAVFWWLLRDTPLLWRVPAMVACVPECLAGNVYAFMAAALVLGVRRGWPWLVPGLTKVQPGLVGAVWLAGSGRWRALVTGGAWTVAVVGLSYLVGPDDWAQWLAFVSESAPGGIGEGDGIVYALAAGTVLLLVFGARTGRTWVLPVATMLLSPTLGVNTLTVLAALPRLALAQSAQARPSVSSGVVNAVGRRCGYQCGPQVAVADMWPVLGLGAVVLLLLGTFGGGAVAEAADVPRWAGSLTGFVLAFLLSGLAMRRASSRSFRE